MKVYKTVNQINGKFYVGKQAHNRDNYLGSGMALKNAINKYGKENFTKTYLEECSNLDELAEREIYWIDKLNAIEEGYNIAKGGKGGDTGGTGGVKKGTIPWNKGVKGAQVAWNKGLKGVCKPNQTSFKAGKDHPQYGVKHSEERKQKIRDSQPNSKAVLHIESGKVYQSSREAERQTEYTLSQIGGDVRGLTKNPRFKYVV